MTDNDQKTKDVATAIKTLGQSYRGDWSDFDGRGLRHELDELADALTSDRPFDLNHWFAQSEICPETLQWARNCQDKAEDMHPGTCNHVPQSSLPRSVSETTTRRIHSTDIGHQKEDLEAALNAATIHKDPTRVDAHVNNISLAGAQGALRNVLAVFGPAVYGAVILFSIEAETSIANHAETMSSTHMLKSLGLTVADLEWPADVLKPDYLDQAAPEDPAHQERLHRIRQGITSWKAAHPESLERAGG